MATFHPAYLLRNPQDKPKCWQDMKKVRKALDEMQFRRKGLGVSLVIIVIVAIALGFKIREIDRRKGVT